VGFRHCWVKPGRLRSKLWFYAKNHNLLLDIMILVQTVEIVLFGRSVR
jgi:lipopolysaccharide/colanic/teichoic acid biosynthesis glycosyltransferase